MEAEVLNSTDEKVIEENSSTFFINRSLFILFIFECFVWFLQYLVSVILISAQVNLGFHFHKYSIPLTEIEKNQISKLEIIGKIFVVLLLAIFSLVEIIASLFYGQILHNCFYLFLNFILFSTLLISTWINNHWKISTDARGYTWLKNYDTTVVISLIGAGEGLTLFQKIRESFDVPESESPHGTFWIFFFIRIIILIILYVEPWSTAVDAEAASASEGDDDPTKKEEKDGDKKKEKEKDCFLSALKHFYPMRHYLIPSTRLTRFYFILLVAFVGIDSYTDFMISIYSMRILNSLQVNTEGRNESIPIEDGVASAKVGKYKLEFHWDYILIYFLIQLLQGNFIWLMKFYLKQQVQIASCGKLQMDIFAKLHKLSLRWHLENQANDIFSVLSYAPNILSDILHQLSYMAPEVLRMFLSIGYLTNNYSFKLSGIVIAAALVSTFIDLFILKRRDKALKVIEEAQTEVRTVRNASFENYETVKYFTNEDYENSKYAKAYTDEESSEMKSTSTYFLFSVFRDIIRYAAEMLVILIVVKLIVDDKGLNSGDYMYFSSIFSRILSPVESFISFYKELQQNAIYAEKVSNILSREPEIMDDPDATELEVSPGGSTVEFRNVDFSYNPDRQIIKGLNLKIPAGQTVALVGHSGCGKSTITKLLFRFYDPTGGEILINGQNIKKVTCRSLRQSIGVVPQDVVLFDETLMDNIKYGKVLTATDEDVIEAAKAACLHDRIESFPDKYKTEVGSRGLKLSGGEKQRVAIARTILKNPSILVLDEATSSLDTETEKQIQVSLVKLCENRTTLIIAHRLSTIVNANMIYVFKEGTVVESGTHNELLAKNGVYTGMWNQQFESEPTTSTIPQRKPKLQRSESYKETELKKRRQMFSNRLKQTVYSVMTRRAFTLDLQ